MTSAEHFPLSYPGDAHRAFGTEEIARRFVKLAQLGGGARVLYVGCGPGLAAIWLAREQGCAVVAVDAPGRGLEALRQEAKAKGLADRLEVREADLKKLPLREGDFDGIIADTSVPLPIAEAVRRLRPYLAPRGRLCLTYPVRVGRHSATAAVELWEQKLGERLLYPRQALQVFEEGGYEPQLIEALPDSHLDRFYDAIEPEVTGAPEAALLAREIELHRAQAGKGCVSFALMVGRRKEPGEKPPPARSDG